MERTRPRHPGGASAYGQEWCALEGSELIGAAVDPREAGAPFGINTVGLSGRFRSLSVMYLDRIALSPIEIPGTPPCVGYP